MSVQILGRDINLDIYPNYKKKLHYQNNSTTVKNAAGLYGGKCFKIYSKTLFRLLGAIELYEF